MLTSGLASLTAPNDAVTFRFNLVTAEGWRGVVEYALVLLILLVLVVVPVILNEKGLDVEGKGRAQGVLLKIITLIACVLTGTYILLLNGKGGALQNVHERPLVVGAIFTVVLLAPYYKSLARACWRGGVDLLSLDTLTKPWSEMRADWRDAKEQRKSSARVQVDYRQLAEAFGKHVADKAEQAPDGHVTPPRTVRPVRFGHATSTTAEERLIKINETIGETKLSPADTEEWKLSPADTEEWK
jgi:hypothetical protein